MPKHVECALFFFRFESLFFGLSFALLWIFLSSFFGVDLVSLSPLFARFLVLFWAFSSSTWLFVRFLAFFGSTPSSLVSFSNFGLSSFQIIKFLAFFDSLTDIFDLFLVALFFQYTQKRLEVLFSPHTFIDSLFFVLWCGLFIWRLGSSVYSQDLSHPDNNLFH